MSVIRFRGSCGRKLKVAALLAGKKVKCPGCQQLHAVPMSSELVEEQEVEETPRSRGQAAVVLSGTMAVLGGGCLGILAIWTSDRPRLGCLEVGVGLVGLLLLAGGLMGIYHTLVGEEVEGDTRRSYSCPKCGRKLSLFDIPEQAGASFTCPKCDATITA